MNLVELGMAQVEADNLLEHGIETVEQLDAYLAEHTNWQDIFGRVVAIAIESFQNQRFTS